jgi:hypothetical protein
MTTWITPWLVAALLGVGAVVWAGDGPNQKDDPNQKPAFSPAVKKAIESNIDKSAVVVEGKVVKVRPVPAPRLAAAGKTERATEHKSEYHEAVIEVKSTLKGQAPKTVVVLFDNSRDPYNRDRPKFRVGDEGVMILHTQEIKNPEARAALMTKDASHEGEIYSALEPHNFIKEDPNRPAQSERVKAVKSMVESRR